MGKKIVAEKKEGISSSFTSIPCQLYPPVARNRYRNRAGVLEKPCCGSSKRFACSIVNKTWTPSEVKPSVTLRFQTIRSCKALEVALPGSVLKHQGLLKLSEERTDEVVKESSPRKRLMITVTRLNNKPIVVNPDLIVFIEQTPDTIITLSNGEKLMVQEKVGEVINRIIKFRRSIFNPSIPIE